MIEPAKTKEERFLMALLESEKKAGTEGEALDPVSIGESIGLAPKGIHAICRQFIRANFVRKQGEEGIVLTDHGRSVGRRLQGF